MTNEPQLKVEKKVLFKIFYGDLDNFISEVYNQEFEFAVAEDCGDSSREFGGIDGILDKYDEKKLKEFIEDGDYSYKTRYILNDLCRKGLIEPGDYLIDAS